MTTVDPSPGQERADLGRRVGRGLKWSMVNTIGVRLMSLASGIVLARLLLPEHFGAMAGALAVVHILFAANDLGILLALVRWEGDVRRAARTAWTVSAIPSFVLYGACFLAAPAFARLVNSPSTSGILRLLAVTVIIDGLTTVPQGLLVREFAQKRMAFIELTAVPVNVVTTVILALAGLGPWALAIGQVVGNLVSGVLLTAAAPFRVRPGFEWPVARTMLAFGIPLALTSLVEYILLNVDYVIVGSLLGPTALGFYVIAYNVSNWPVNLISDAIRRVSIAGFARLQGDVAALRANFARTYALLLTLAAPVVLVLAFLAPELVRFVYGSRWVPSGEVLQVLALLGGTRIAAGFVFDLLVGAGRSRTTLWLQSVWLAALVPALVVGGRVGGIRGVAIAHVGVGLLLALPLFVGAVGRFGVDLSELRRRLVRPFVGAVAALAVGLLLRPEVPGLLPRLLVLGPAMVATYVAVVVPRQLLSPSRWPVTRRRGAPEEAPPAPAPAET